MADLVNEEPVYWWRAACLSSVLPGLGHFATNPRRGRVILITNIFVVGAVACWLVVSGPTQWLKWTVQPRWLLTLIGLSLALLVFRVVVALDAARLAATGPLWGRSARMVGLSLIIAYISIPHLLVAFYAQSQVKLLQSVFVEAETSTARPSDEVEFDNLGDWGGEERLTILLLGSDGGFDRSGIRTDTMIVVSIEVATGNAVSFSIPRNWGRAPFPAGTPAAQAFPNGFDQRINAVYGIGMRRPELFPDTEDPAGTAVKQSIAQLLGIPIQYYVLVDMQSVVKTVDLFGGVDITVTESINDRIKPITPGGPWLDINVSPGPHHFDGLTTLAYIRSRVQSSDYNRMSRQRCVVGAFIDQISSTELARNYPALSGIIADHVSTDIPLDRLPELLEVADRLDISRIQTVNFVPPEFPAGNAPTELVRAAVIDELDFEPTDGSTTLRAACE